MNSSRVSSILGSWRLVSLGLRMEDTGEIIEPFGPHPDGSIIFTSDGRMMTVINASGRPSGETESEMAAAFRGMMAYTGPFSIEGDRVTIEVDASWHPSWERTRQVRFVELDGDRLTLTSEVQGHPANPDRKLRGIIRWMRSGP